MTALNLRPLRTALLSAFAVIMISCDSGYEFAYLYKDLPFKMEKVQRPQIPAREVSVADFGAVGDGVTLNTDAFAQAIDVLYQAGGGRLVVPTGVWLTGPITLKDNIDLHVRPDAVLLFSTDRDLYPIVETVFEGLDTKRCLSMLTEQRISPLPVVEQLTVTATHGVRSRNPRFLLLSGRIFSRVAALSMRKVISGILIRVHSGALL